MSQDVTNQANPKWTTSGWGYSVKSQDQTFRAITRIVSLAAGRQYVRRGCSNRAYRIRSSLVRHLIIDEQESLPTERRWLLHRGRGLREALT